MPKYFDAVEYDICDLSSKTTLYLYKSGDVYFIKGISCDISQLSSDPASRANEYWPVNTEDLLGKINSNDAAVMEALFPRTEEDIRENRPLQLTDKPLSLAQVKVLLGVDPQNTPPQLFSPQAAEGIQNDNNFPEILRVLMEDRQRGQLLPPGGMEFLANMGGLFAAPSDERPQAPAQAEQGEGVVVVTVMALNLAANNLEVLDVTMLVALFAALPENVMTLDLSGPQMQ